MSQKPLVSIIIPCYNHEQFLDDCLTSLINQSYENMELFICDDCSPDNSFEIIKGYESALNSRFIRTVILKNEVNLGITANINRMLEDIKGKYVKILASDDALETTAIEEMVDFLEKNPEKTAVVSNGIKVSEKERYPLFTPIEKIYKTVPNFSKVGLIERVAICNEISAPATMIRADVYEKFGFYDQEVKVEDFEYWLRILSKGNCEFAFLDKPLVYYRLNQNSMTSIVKNKNLENRRRLILFSELKTLYKYKEDLSNSVFATAVLSRILAARWFSVENEFWAFAGELEKMWREFEFWNYLTIVDRLNFKKRDFRITVKKFLRKTIRLG